ncbi:MAG: hypothetical protein ACRC1P_09715 [Cellulosilyticaceae bacterium]
MKDVITIPCKVLIRDFDIKFSYITKRDNDKVRSAKISATTRDEAEFWFHQWVENYNKLKEFKAYSNVKILECVETNRKVIEI